MFIYLRRHHIQGSTSSLPISSPELTESHSTSHPSLLSRSGGSLTGSNNSTTGTMTDSSTNSTSGGSSNSQTSRSLNSRSRLAKGDSLENLRDSKLGPPLSEEETRHVFKQIASSIYYCHSLNIIHRDIKHKVCAM